MTGKPIAPEADRDILKALQAVFPPEYVRFLPMDTKRIKDGCVRVAAYLDARGIVERLNEVMGLGWQDSYDVMPDGNVQCRLTLRVGEQWITRSDVGAPSSQPDAGDKMKAAHSDALKRAAVKFGIGLYLYRIGNLYAKWDGNRVTESPALPLWCVPEDYQETGEAFATAVVNLAKVACERAGYGLDNWRVQSLDRYGYDGKTPLAKVEKRHARRIMEDLNAWLGKLARETAAAPAPRDGKELHAKLTDWEKGLVAQKFAVPGQLLAHVVSMAAKGSFPPSMDAWNGAAVAKAWEWAGEFVTKLVDTGKAPKPERQPAGK